MKDITIYCVQYKETTLGEDNILETRSGVCDYAYYNEGDAIKKVNELVEEKVDECITNTVMRKMMLTLPETRTEIIGV